MSATLLFRCSHPSRRSGRAALAVEALEERLVLTGEARLVMSMDYFYRPVSVVAAGPAVMAALVFVAPSDPGAQFGGGPGGQGAPALVSQNPALPVLGGYGSLTSAAQIVPADLAAEAALSAELLEAVVQSLVQTRAPDSLVPA